MDRGIMGGMMRSAFGGESMFSQTLYAEMEGDVVLGAPEIGDVEIVRVTHGSTYLMQKGAFLAADEHVDISTATQTSMSGALFSGTGLFVLRASGQGSLAIAAHGAILPFNLATGEVRAVDNGHLVAWSESMRLEMKLAGGGRGLSSLYSSAASGEGLMCFFTGPGTVWLQTHKPMLTSEVSENGKTRVVRSAGGGGGGLGSCLCSCLFFLIVAAVLAGVFVVVPAYGGRWVEQYPGSGSYTLKWDPPSPPSRAKPRIRHSSSRYESSSSRYESQAGYRPVHEEDEL